LWMYSMAFVRIDNLSFCTWAAPMSFVHDFMTQVRSLRSVVQLMQTCTLNPRPKTLKFGPLDPKTLDLKP
jgi:hypothetical protein